VITDSLVGFAYLAISVTLGYLGYKGKRDIPFHWMFSGFWLVHSDVWRHPLHGSDHHLDAVV
jgi:hypothetical protein